MSLVYGITVECDFGPVGRRTCENTFSYQTFTGDIALEQARREGWTDSKEVGRHYCPEHSETGR